MCIFNQVGCQITFILFHPGVHYTDTAWPPGTFGPALDMPRQYGDAQASGLFGQLPENPGFRIAVQVFQAHPGVNLYARTVVPFRRIRMNGSETGTDGQRQQKISGDKTC